MIEMEYRKLSDCAEFRSERTTKINVKTYITTENMIKNKGGISVSDTLPEMKTASAYKPSDILLSNIRPYFKKIWYSNRFGSCSNDILVIKSHDEMNPKFLFYVLSDNNFFNYATVTSKGTKMPRGTKSAIMKYLVPKIDILKQEKIADILSAYDNLIENNNKRIKLLEQMAENLYKEWFVRFRFPGYEDVEFIDGFPKDWKKVQLDDVLNKIATGLNPRKNFVLGEGENFYVTIKNMADNTVYLDDKCDKVNDDAIIKINKRSDLKIGDLLFSGIGTIGRVCLIDIPTNDWNISESVFTMRANKKISSEFLYLLLLSQDVQNYCQSKANGSAQKGIRMGDLRKYTFLLPTKNVINDFTNQISPILRNVSLLRNENKNLIQQRDLLLPRLMSGKLEV